MSKSWPVRLTGLALALAFAMLTLHILSSDDDSASAPPALPSPHPYPEDGSPAAEVIEPWLRKFAPGPPAEPGTADEFSPQTVRYEWWAAQDGKQPQQIVADYPATHRRSINFLGGDVFSLGGQIVHYGQNGKKTIPDVIAGMHIEYCLGPSQRQAILRIVADTPQMRSLGPVTDRHGRRGWGFALRGQDVHGNQVRDILVFDQTTVGLLSFERLLPQPHPAGPGPSTVAMYAVFDSCTSNVLVKPSGPQASNATSTPPGAVGQ